MATQPLPARTAANDKLIASTPYNQLTDRQKQYADKYGLTLQPLSPSGDKGSWLPPTRPNIPASLADNVTLPVARAPIGDVAEAASDDPNKLAAQRDALALIRNTFAQYGLPDSLADWAWGEIVAGKGNAEIMLDLRQRPEFKAEFPEIEARQKAGLSALSPGDIISYRANVRQMMRAAGLPEGFYDSKEDFTKFIVGDVSAKELGDRINLAAQAAYQAPQEFRDSLAEWGVNLGDMTSFWLNPDVAQPLLERKFAAAQLAGAAKRSGFGSLAEGEATNLAQIGITEDQAQSGFGKLADSRELFTPLDAGEDAIGRQEQINAVFGGNSTNVRRIEQRRRRRQATYEAGGQYAAGDRGITGLATPRN